MSEAEPKMALDIDLFNIPQVQRYMLTLVYSNILGYFRVKTPLPIIGVKESKSIFLTLSPVSSKENRRYLVSAVCRELRVG